MSALEQALGGPAIEVVAKATRRRFTEEYKRKIVREADGCKTPGAVGALLRREGLYSSHLTTGAPRGNGASWPGRRRSVGPRGGSSIRATRSWPSKRARSAGGRSAPSELRRWSNCKNKWRRCWERRWPPSPRDGDGHPERTAAGHRPHVRRARAAARDLLPSAPAPAGRAAAAPLTPGAQLGRARRGPRPAACATLRGSRA